MPFQSWELQATGDDSAKFTVLAACSENVFEIKVIQCSFVTCFENKHLMLDKMDLDCLFSFL